MCCLPKFRCLFLIFSPFPQWCTMQPSNQNFTTEVFRFGPRMLIAFLTFLNAFVPLSMDLYLPALPHMSDVFQCERWLTELTLSGFMLFFGLSMLCWGAFSDKYGRKPILTTGLCLFLIGSTICIFSMSIYMLICGRLFQAIGSGAISSVSMAIIKDSFKGKSMENVLILVQTMTTLAPIIAPIVGAFFLHLTSWRGLFCILGSCSIIALIVSFSLKETMKNPTQGSALTSLKRIGIVLQNESLRRLLFLFALAFMPFMAYLTSSSFIYVKVFGLTEEQFSAFFATNGALAMLGPLMYSRVFRKWNRRFYLSLCYAMMMTAGVLLYFFGGNSPFAFLACYGILTFFAGSCRPVGTLLMMSQLDTDSGTVAALMGCSSLLFGSLSMMLCSLNFGGPIISVSGIAFIIGTVCFFLWRYLDKNKLYRNPSSS